MRSIDEIEEIITGAGLHLAGVVAENPITERSYFIPIAMGPTVKGRRNPSGRLLSDTKKRLRAVGYNAEFILMSASKKRIEEGLRHSLMSSFPNLVRNSFLSGEDNALQVWLETKRTLDKQASKQLQVHVEEFAKLFSMKTMQLNLLSDAQTPTKTELLFLIRILAPVGLDSLRDRLLADKLEVPSLDWLNRQLDTLRRAGLLIRTKSGHYGLTLDALRRLGTARGRRSRDVDRLLALARRKD